MLHGALDGASGLPQPLRAHLVELAEVSIRHASYVLCGDAAVDPLIAGNRSIIEGPQWTAASLPQSPIAERSAARPLLPFPCHPQRRAQSPNRILTML